MTRAGMAIGEFSCRTGRSIETVRDGCLTAAWSGQITTNPNLCNTTGASGLTTMRNDWRLGSFHATPERPNELIGTGGDN